MEYPQLCMGYISYIQIIHHLTEICPKHHLKPSGSHTPLVHRGARILKGAGALGQGAGSALSTGELLKV
jgi:hypothetical protein